MAKYALVVTGVVRNVVEASTAAVAQSMLTGSVAVDVTALRVSPGDTYNGSVFTAGPPPNTNFPEEFQDLFCGKVTPAELITIGVAVTTDSQLRVIWDLFVGQRMSIEKFLDNLVLKNLITSARRAEFKV